MILKRLLVLIAATTIFIIGCTPQGNNRINSIWYKDEIFGLKIIQSQIISELKDNEQTISCDIVVKNTTNRSFDNFIMNIMFPNDWPQPYQNTDKYTPIILNAGEQKVYKFERVHEINKKNNIISAKRLQKISIHFTFNMGDTAVYNGVFNQK